MLRLTRRHFTFCLIEEQLLPQEQQLLAQGYLLLIPAAFLGLSYQQPLLLNFCKILTAAIAWLDTELYERYSVQVAFSPQAPVQWMLRP